MKLVRQPRDSNLCGQSCIATLANISLEDACLVVGTKGCTNTADLKAALDLLGIKHAERRTRGEPSDTALLYFQSKDRKAAHWVLWHRKKYYDPAAGVFCKMPHHLEDSDMTSYLKVEL